MKTAVIYARYSSDSQTEQSIEGQLRVCEEYAQRNNIVILDTYIDRAMTGTNDNRPDFLKMIKDSNKKEWNYVIVYKLDRFSRNKYETTIHKHELAQNGVKLLSAMENIPDTPEGIILESLLEGMNQYYSAELSQKVKRGMNETRLKGNFTGGTIIYGYRVENHKVKIIEEQAEVVRYIYNQYSKGVFVKDIIKSLNEKGIYKNGKPFARNSVYNILKNEKYAGIYRHNGEVFDNMYPQIVPFEIYDIVRQKTLANKYGKRSVEVVYLLRHKLTCGYCGMPISAECGTSSKGKKIHYYKCLGRKRGNGCTQPMVRKELFEEFIVKTILKVLNNEKYTNIIIENLLKIQEEQFNQNTKLNMLIKDKKQNETMLDNIMKAVEQGLMNNTTNKRMKEIENNINDLDTKILIEKSKNNVKLNKLDIEKYYIEALKLEPFMLINYLIKNIKVFEDKIEITFNSPIEKSSDNNQNINFYSNNLKMPKVVQNQPKLSSKDMKVNIYV